MASFDRFVETRWAYVALAALVFLLAVPGVIAMPVMDRDEGRFAEASSEMLETGDFVVIRYHDDLRNKKPVAIHWLQAATVAATTGAQDRNIGAYRLPSLFGAMLAAMATMWAGAALFNRRAAFIGGALIGACLLLTSEAHIAKTDAVQCGILTLGMAALAWMREGRSVWKMSILFWVCLGAGVMLKGVIAPLVMGTTIIALFAWERKYDWARPLLSWAGISLFCVITIPWYVAVQIATEGEFLFEAAAVDLGQKIVSAAEGHDGPPGMHTAALPVLFWPATVLLVPGVWLAVSRLMRMRRNGGDKAAKPNGVLAFDSHEARAWRFLACWIVPSWIVFEIAPTKLFHYTLPMYPAFALAAGAAADAWFRTREWTRGRWVSLGLFLGISVLIALLASPWALAALRADAAADFSPALADRVAFEWEQTWNATGIGYWPTLLILLAALWTAYAAWKKSALALLGGILACSIAGGVLFRSVVLPNQSWILSTRASLSALTELCALPEGSAVLEKSGCEARAPRIIRAISFAEPSLVFHLGNKITLPPASKPVIPPVSEDARPAWLINTGEEAGREALEQLVAAAASADRCIRFARRYAMNYSNGDPSILVAAVVEPAGCPSSGPPPELRERQEDPAPELEN